MSHSLVTGDNIVEDMYNEITDDIVERMSHYTDSRQPTGDEVRIAWLVGEVVSLRRTILELKSKYVPIVNQE